MQHVDAQHLDRGMCAHRVLVVLLLYVSRSTSSTTRSSTVTRLTPDDMVGGDSRLWAVTMTLSRCAQGSLFKAVSAVRKPIGVDWV